jgi:Fe-S-cluster-containing dehydrogenase component
VNRREFLRATGAAVGTGFVHSAAEANEANEPETATSIDEFVGVLVDTTRCIGCRSCELACSREHGMYEPDLENDEALESTRPTSEVQWTVVNRHQTTQGEVFVKTQCMHCWQPACAAACLTNAMYKTPEGPVIWRSDKCMGCRFCMISCPFNMPKFEYHDWNPRIQKCTLCFERLAEGKKPACVEACPTDALMLGSKRDLMEVARVRIYNHPDDYVHEIYGEHIVGGTGWLYLSAVPFAELGLPTDLDTRPYPEFTRDFLYGVPLVLFGLPALLLGAHLLAERDDDA